MAAKKTPTPSGRGKKAAKKKTRATTATRKKQAAKKPRRSVKSRAIVCDRFEGMRICLAGKPLQYQRATREEYEEWITSDGGTLVATVDASTDLLIVLGKGATAAAKKKAAALNAKGALIREIDESEFRKIFQPTKQEAIELLKSGSVGTERLRSLIAHCNLWYTPLDLREAGLRGCDLSGLMWNWAELDGADLRGAILNGTRMAKGTDLGLEKATGSQFLFEHLSDCRFIGADLPEMGNGPGWGMTVENCDFTHARLIGANFSATSFKSTSFHNAILTKARLGSLRDVDLRSADLTNASLGGKLRDVDFGSADLTNASIGVSCKACSFAKAKLVGAKLSHAHFDDADLTGVDFRNAFLVAVDLSQAKISNARFDGAIVVGCSLEGADVSRAKGLRHPPSPGQACQELLDAAKDAYTLTIDVVVSIPEGVVKAKITVIPRYYTHTLEASFTAADSTLSEIPIPYGLETNKLNEVLQLLGQLNSDGPIEISRLRISAKHDVDKKALREVVTAALSEALGIGVLSAADVKGQVKKARKAKASLKQEMVDELRGGKAGITKFNSRRTAGDKTEFDLRKEDFSGAVLSGAKCSYANFQGSNFGDAKLVRAKLQSGNFRDCSFKNADLGNANLSSSRLAGADFSQATLTKANLSKCNLDRATLAGADATGANFAGSSLLGANLQDAMLDDVKLKGCAFDDATVFPAGFVIPYETEFKGKGHDPRHVVDHEALAEVLDFRSFMDRLNGTVDQSRLKKSLKMLKADRFELFSEVGDDAFTGVVKSQTDPDLVYSCRLSATGEFACCTQNLNACGGLRGALCKHLLVLIVGLTKVGQIDAQTAATWADASNACKPDLDKDVMSEVLLKYKGAEAGEVDWRPVETIPEDYYAF